MKPQSPVRGARIPTKGSRSYLFQRSPGHKHRGIDLFAPLGTPVVAPTDGVVVKTGEGWRQGFTGYGSFVVLETLGPQWQLFSHLDSVDVREGQPVRQGEQLGTVGTSAGTRTDPDRQFARSKPHMHWEISPRPYPQRSEEARVDPVAWLKSEGQRVMGGGFAVAAVLVALWVSRKS